MSTFPTRAGPVPDEPPLSERRLAALSPRTRPTPPAPAGWTPTSGHPESGPAAGGRESDLGAPVDPRDPATDPLLPPGQLPSGSPVWPASGPATPAAGGAETDPAGRPERAAQPVGYERPRPGNTAGLPARKAPHPTREAPPAGRPAGSWFRLHGAIADHLPPVLRGGVVDPAARGALAIALVALLAALVAGWYAWHSRATPTVLPAATIESTSPTPGLASASAPGSAFASAPANQTSGEVVVDVAGRVRRPGVVRLPAGARVVDALVQAGGALPGTDTSGVQLARRLSDGEQILVTGQPATAPPAGSAVAPSVAPSDATTAGTPSSPIDLNAATAEQLDALPGVGPVLARRIVAWREQHGRFTSTQQLREVQGVGEKKLADLLPLVRV